MNLFAGELSTLVTDGAAAAPSWSARQAEPRGANELAGSADEVRADVRETPPKLISQLRPTVGASVTAPFKSSPLRQVSFPVNRPSSLDWLALGDRRFQSEGKADLAAFYWMLPHDLKERDASYAALFARPPTHQADVAMHLFHLAHLAPRALHARVALQRAYKLAPRVLPALEGLLTCAKQHPQFAAPAAQLWRRFGAMTLGARMRQRQLWDAVQARDWAMARTLGVRLRLELPGLLSARCAMFLSDWHQLQNRLGGAVGLGAEYNPVFAAGEILRFVLGLDGDGHFEAMGALGVREHRGLWGQFLDAFFVAAPELFAPAYRAGPQLAPPAERSLCGLPWQDAVALPLGRRWREQVAYRSEQAVTAARRPSSSSERAA